jgi:hypothetical protein
LVAKNPATTSPCRSPVKEWLERWWHGYVDVTPSARHLVAGRESGCAAARPDPPGVLVHVAGLNELRKDLNAPRALADYGMRREDIAEEDQFVPLARVDKTAGARAALGARIELTSYDDPLHQINDDSIVRLRRMLRKRLLERVEIVANP